MGGSSTAVNLGMGRGYSVREVIAAAERVTARPIRCAKRRAVPAVSLADASRASHVLNCRMHFAEIEDLIRTVWRCGSQARPGSPAKVTRSKRVACSDLGLAGPRVNDCLRSRNGRFQEPVTVCRVITRTEGLLEPLGFASIRQRWTSAGLSSRL